MKVLFGASQLRGEVRRLGAEVSAAYPGGVVMVAVLKGGVWFLADLVRELSVPVEVDFLAVSSYSPGSGRVRLLKDLEIDIADRDVVLVEDIVDTGLSLSYLLAELGQRGPRSLEVCALLDRQVRRIVPIFLRFRGLPIGDEFVVGYGLDHDQRFRNLDRLVALDRAELASAPDAHVAALFSG